MITNHIKIAWRSLSKAKALNAIHIFGLAVAIASSTLLYLTAMFELSFDNFHEHRERVGLLYTEMQPEEGTKRSSTVATPLAPVLKTGFPEMAYVSRYMNSGIILRNGDKQLEASNKYVDPDFLSIFSFPFVAGNTSALNELDNLVIDETTANNLFGSPSVIGKQVEVYQNGKWGSKTISAVLAKIPNNSSLTFNTLLRFEHKPNYQANLNDWGHEDHSVFVKLKSGSINDEAFTKKAKPFVDLYYKDEINMRKRDGWGVDKNGAYVALHLLPLTKYHRNDLGVGHGSAPLYPWILLIIAGLILFIACSNFVNLSLANSFARNREIGTRKTLGGTTFQLMAQLWTESLLLCILATCIGIGLAWVLLAQYNAIMNYSLSIAQLLSPLNLLFFLLTFLLLTLVSGGYPAWRIAKANIIQTLKGKVSVKSSRLRNSLTVLQFSIAIVLILATIVISFQLRYMAERPLGFDKTEVISIPIGEGIDPENALQQMRVALAAHPWVQAVSASDMNLGRGRDGSMSTSRFGFDFEGKQIYTNFMRVDFDYLKTLGIKLLDGRDFDRRYLNDTASVVINRQMAMQLGGADKVLGKTLEIDGNPQVIGVIDDFNFQDLRRKVEPLTLSINPNIFSVSYIFVRVKTDNLGDSMSKLEDIWKKINPKANIAASYLDENTQNMYRDEQRFVQIVISGAIVAISISCLGLFALALLMINKRVKEIGIRKVLGSSVMQIMLLLSKEFMGLMLIAFFIASPLAWWMMRSWLQGYAYRIDIQWWMFAAAGILITGIALATITWQTLRAATSNPVDSLRDE
ncbi:ABC transporter permease [Sphingobacterium griseoflavum]|uniref:ABC transporter permease n=1 Tax=Sphingobacterium griseoflavum TaxID=1474952 RepID=A0ABQ3HW87_9SPHI|nr:ABC transporter permease [Sphingobacterium griseoflavum]GHE23623.1 ABC transporter permease [Sphingobacterium griseoflavum]